MKKTLVFFSSLGMILLWSIVILWAIKCVYAEAKKTTLYLVNEKDILFNHFTTRQRKSCRTIEARY